MTQMQVTVNGSAQALPEPCSVAQALAALRPAGQPCAVEVNGTLVRHGERGGVLLQHGDRIEIVTLVGGG
ncbi:MAG: sulfur carrier protein ThiS [Planctomycetes bacterium]|nr:sulfur carrier protein ThiS [Planctomycetota bacterium]